MTSVPQRKYRTLDVVERSMVSIREEQKRLQSQVRQTEDAKKRQALQTSISKFNEQLKELEREVAEIQSNARYLLLLSGCAMLIFFVIWTVMDWPSPVTWISLQSQASIDAHYGTHGNEATYSQGNGLPTHDPLGSM